MTLWWVLSYIVIRVGEYINSMYTVHCTVYSVYCTLYSVQCTAYTVRHTWLIAAIAIVYNSITYILWHIHTCLFQCSVIETDTYSKTIPLYKCKIWLPLEYIKCIQFYNWNSHFYINIFIIRFANIETTIIIIYTYSYI